MSETPGDRPAEDKSRKPAWLPLGAAALIVPTALAGITLAWPRPQIEIQLGQRATEALSAAGIPAAGVVFSGRDATISGVPAALRDKAIAAVEGATGVRVAAFPEPGSGGGVGGGAGGGPGGGPAAPFGLKETGDSIALTGVVGSEEERQRLVSAAAAQAGGRSIEDKLTVTPGATLPPGLNPPALTAVAGALAVANGDVTASLAGDKLTLTGTVPDQATKDAVAQKVTAALPGITIDNQLTLSGAGAGGGTGAVTTPGGDLDPAAKQALQGKLAALVSGAPITFAANSPQLTSEGSATVAKVLDLLKTAPGARLQIDGYVAAGPGDGKLTAQQLSDARAATVRDALVAGGVPADHIAVRGLGEGATPAQSAAARRVEITVV